MGRWGGGGGRRSAKEGAGVRGNMPESGGMESGAPQQRLGPWHSAATPLGNTMGATEPGQAT